MIRIYIYTYKLYTFKSTYIHIYIKWGKLKIQPLSKLTERLDSNVIIEEINSPLPSICRLTRKNKKIKIITLKEEQD